MANSLMNVTRIAVAVVTIANLTACATITNRPTRLAHSSYGCMEAVLREKLPAELPDKRAHCLAGGLISRYCSITEAYLAGAGKEVRDLLGKGDAEWADWRADRVGIECAGESSDDAALAQCCSARGY
jgi:hypothetical protein